VAGVKGAHGRDEANGLAAGTPLGRDLSQVANGANDFEGIGQKLRSRRHFWPEVPGSQQTVKGIKIPRP